ncbi:hypothetical protein [Spiroplasma alleghenense]|uniref:Uncharacterized protein n=1 Tax=Spiroplasma alleghenense TaxID=216931 RepID=A0A345Z4X2_9MOLU|nr:hypothetical protein [Spiroplasma alleghenense]AXK51651.1 hypothetical protein SALLE_v1c09810 [Spiroplasma alleghenense]
MKKILKILAVISPVVFLSNQVVSCVDNRIDINELVEVTDLGYIENLSLDTINQTLILKNPKTHGLGNIFMLEGDFTSYSAKMGVHPAYHNKYKGFVDISYNSKLGYKTKDDSNQFDCVISNESSSCEIDISILDSSYDLQKDKDINVDNYNEDFIQTSKELIKEDGVYRVYVSKVKEAELNLNFDYSFRVHWYYATFVECNIIVK